MSKQNASLDASFWINIHKSDLTDHLSTYFNLFVTTTVIQEIEYIPPGLTSLTASGQVFRQWRAAGQITEQDPSQPVDWFHPGENAAIALAREHGYLLLIDDQAPYHFSKAQGLRVAASADFIILLYADKFLSYDEAMARLARTDAAVHLKRAAAVALTYLSRQKDK